MYYTWKRSAKRALTVTLAMVVTLAMACPVVTAHAAGTGSIWEQKTYVYGDGNEGQVHEITKKGIYYLGDGATGALTIRTTGKVVLVGKGIEQVNLFDNLRIDIPVEKAQLTLQDVGISNTDYRYHVLDFTGSGNTLTIEGECLLDYIAPNKNYSESGAAVHVPYGGSLTVNGSGTYYQYNNSAGAGIGGAAGEMNGEIVFDMTGSAFIKGTKQGAVIGAGAGASSSTDKPGAIRFKNGVYNLISNSRGAVIGGSAGSTGGSSGTNVYIEGGSININMDFSGAMIGGGGYKEGNDASGGTVYISGGSLRTYVDKNAALYAFEGFRGIPLTEGLNDVGITAQRKNDKGEDVYKCTVDVSSLGEGPYTVLVDGKPFFTGGRHEYYYVNQNFDKDKDQYANTDYTPDNWLKGEDYNLYLYLTAGNHEITVNGVAYKAYFDEETLEDTRMYTDGAFVVARKGDVNQNGVVNSVDATLINRALVSESNAAYRPLSKPEQCFADVDGNGRINMVDAQRILRATISPANAAYLPLT